MSETIEPDKSVRLDGRSARRAATFTVVFQSLSKLIGIPVAVILVRLLSEEEYGAYNVYYSIIGLIGAVLSLGLSNTLARFLPEYHANHNDLLAHQLYRYASFARLAANILLLIALWIFWDRVAAFFQIAQYENVYLVFAFVVVTYFQASMLVTTLAAYLLQQFSFGAQFLFAATKLVGYTIVLLTMDVSLRTILIIDFLAYLLMYVWLKIAYQRHAPAPFNHGEVNVPIERKRLFRYAFFYNFNDFGQFSIGTKIDFLFLAAMTDPITVGAYGLARKMEDTSTNFLPVKFFQSVIRPLFFSLNVEKEAEKVNAYFRILTKLTYLSLFPLCVLMIVAYKPITIGLLDGKFSDFSALFSLIFLFALLAGFQKPLMLVIQLSERAGVVLISKFFGILNIAGLYLLIPLWGAFGAAAATGATVILSRVFLWWSVRKIVRVRELAGFMLYGGVFWSAVLALQFWITSGIANPFLALAVIALCTTLAALLFFRGPVFGSEDKQLLADILRPREKRYLVRLGLLSKSDVLDEARIDADNG